LPRFGGEFAEFRQVIRKRIVVHSGQLPRRRPSQTWTRLVAQSLAGNAVASIRELTAS
jgi:hypothetical protein